MILLTNTPKNNCKSSKKINNFFTPEGNSGKTVHF